MLLPPQNSNFRFGEGQISGVISCFLGVLCLGGVLCFYFPEYLTTPELRQVYSVEFLRSLLATFIGISFFLGLLSFYLSKKKTLSLVGILLSFFSILLGGSQVPVAQTISSNQYIGLDWFILDILMVTIVFVPIEGLFFRLQQKIFREGWKTDLYHFLFGHLFVQVTSFLILVPSLYFGSKIANPSLQLWIQSQNSVIQFLEVLILADFTQYWVHRLFHQIPFLWRFHLIHHSIQELDWLAGSRLHLVEVVVTRGITLVPLFVLGFHPQVLQAYLVFVAFWATFIHLNLRFEFRRWQKLFAMPIYHHWHHAIEKEAIDKNFAIHLPIIDKIFGTYYQPMGQWPRGYGVKEQDVPDSYLGQLLYPFKK